ncbi:GMC family oxidoreductase [Mycolicibacterium sp. P1-18]|uniref:GMC oxidoreductase n=1 Tax=Mycolicibacterium sp. P1-18 TaxID=2024615 RepID=UPI0011F1777A|nr:GMC family oxidoreductase [Mycolicibacterium sp. P1-18]KAA0097913.1 GMC family oxidoreductase [Mycolicibacterium sp. P1-18]
MGLDDDVSDTTDYLVIGSGFGGSVMAATLAESPHQVCLLERGKAYPPGSFPRTPDGFAKNFWDPSEGLHGLFNVWSFDNVDAIVSSGLGGGSLIYANVMLEKPAEWFTQPRPDGPDETWSFDHDDLLEHYEAVREFLHVGTMPTEFMATESTKTRRFLDASEGAGELAPLAVRFHGTDGTPAIGAPLPTEGYGSIFGTPRRTTCRMIGECDIGCNEGAKSSMDHTYISLAAYRGASVHARTEVRTIRVLDGAPEGYRFEVTFVRHPAWAEGQPRNTKSVGTHTIRAKRVVLAAGALGTTYLMLMNRTRLALPANSPVGERFCDNGDHLAVAVPLRDTQDFAANEGPVITAYRRFETTSDAGDGRPPVRMYLQDGGVPTIMVWVLQMLGARGLVSRLVAKGTQYVWQRVTNTNDNNVSAELSEILGVSPPLARSLPLLGMGEDVANGRLRVDKKGTLVNSWTPADSRHHFSAMRVRINDLSRHLGGQWKAKPDVPTERTVTVHPLGGCPADTSRFAGVVDSFGRVRGVPGLWIADGSVMPGPVGANPSLTIAAFARRAAMELRDEDVDGPPSVPLPPPTE